MPVIPPIGMVLPGPGLTPLAATIDVPDFAAILDGEVATQVAPVATLPASDLPAVPVSAKPPAGDGLIESDDEAADRPDPAIPDQSANSPALQVLMAIVSSLPVIQQANQILPKPDQWSRRSAPTNLHVAPTLPEATVAVVLRPTPSEGGSEPVATEVAVPQSVPISEPHLAVAEVRQAPVNPISAVSPAPIQQMFEALARRDPVDRQWLDTVIRDVSTVAAKTANVRFRVEPENLGSITIERTAERVEIGVSDPRSLALVEAARPQMLAGAAALGVPVASASVVLDQSGFRQREDTRPRHRIDQQLAEDDGENNAPDAGRYA